MLPISLIDFAYYNDGALSQMIKLQGIKLLQQDKLICQDMNGNKVIGKSSDTYSIPAGDNFRDSKEYHLETSLYDYL